MGHFTNRVAADTATRVEPAAERTAGTSRPNAVVIPRPYLERAYAAAPASTPVRIAAPAGWGATTLLGRLADMGQVPGADLPVVWMRCRRDDADAGHAVRSLGTALSATLPLRTELAELLDASPPPVPTVLSAALANAVRERPEIMLVIDDVHLLGDAAASALAPIVAAVDESGRVLVAGRHVPAWALGQRSPQGQVLDWGPDELAFAADEVLMFSHAVGANLDDGDIAEILAWCGGWAFGVEVAFDYVGDGRLLGIPPNDDAALTAFVTDEVLGGLAGPIASFVRTTALCDRFTPAMLDEVTGSTNTMAMLADITRHVGAVYVTDQEVAGLRPPLAGVVAASVRRNTPSQAAEIERHIARVYATHGQLDAAIGHALGADDTELAAEFVLADAAALSLAGESARLAQRIGRLGADAPHRFPHAALAQAWLAVANGSPTQLDAALDIVRSFDEIGPLADGTPSLAAGAAIVTAIGADGGTDGILAATRIVRDAGDATTNPWWGLATMMRGATYVMRDEMHDAVPLLESVRSSPHQPPQVVANAGAFLAIATACAGNVADAASLGAEAAGLGWSHNLDRLLSSATIFAVAAWTAALHDRSDSETARRTALRLLRSLGPFNPRTTLLGRSLLAQEALVRGDRVAARTQLAIAEELAAICPDAAFPIRLVGEFAQALTTP